MGNDGGSIPKRIDLVKTKKEHIIKQKRKILEERFKSCSFTNNRLKLPIIICKKGFLFNKESLLEAIINKSLPAKLTYIKRLKDIKQIRVKMNPNPKSDIPLLCPLTAKEINGVKNFVCVWKCGCLLNEKMLLSLAKVGYSMQEVSSLKAQKDIESAQKKLKKKKYVCPNCSKKFALKDLTRLNNVVESDNNFKESKDVRELKMKLSQAKQSLGKRTHLKAIKELEEHSVKLKKTKDATLAEKVFGLPKPGAYVGEAFHKSKRNKEDDLDIMHRNTRHGIR